MVATTMQLLVKHIMRRGRWIIPATSSLFLLALPLLASQADLKTELEQTINKQKDCWNKGDLDGFMSVYLNSKDICFTSSGVEVWGYDALRERYQKKYGANKDTMGKLDFRDLRITELSPKSALVIGHWHLERNSGAPMAGTFSLVLVKAKGEWKIIHDHSSLLSEKK